MQRFIAAAAFTLTISSQAQAQTQPRIQIAVSGGIAELRGGGLVHSATEPAIAARVTLRPFSRVGFDVEASRTGSATSPDYNRRADWQWREIRRETIVAGYVRAIAWRNKLISIEPVAGAARLKPDVQGFQRGYNPVTNRFSEWRRGEPGGFGYDGFYLSDKPHWTFAFGADVAIGNRRAAIVPEFRVYSPLWGSEGVGSDYGVHTRGALGLRVGF